MGPHSSAVVHCDHIPSSGWPSPGGTAPSPDDDPSPVSKSGCAVVPSSLAAVLLDSPIAAALSSPLDSPALDDSLEPPASALGCVVGHGS
jgi:hypothetical protein